MQRVAPRLSLRQLVSQKPLDRAAGDQKGFILDDYGHILAGHGIRAFYGGTEHAYLEVAGSRIALKGAALALHQRLGPI